MFYKKLEMEKTVTIDSELHSRLFRYLAALAPKKSRYCTYVSTHT
jgi:hypothetical protein